MLPIRIGTRGPKYGRCNICGEEGKLTEDHTPPKGCIKINLVDLHHIIEHLNVEQPKSKGRLSQNGVKYRTLCSKCNNNLLGGEYDPSFISFVNMIGNYLKSNIHLPPVMHVTTKPQRVMRSLLGHMCAQGVNRYDKGSITEPIKEYFQDQSKPLPDNIKIYYWPFPYSDHVMARDCVLMDLRIREPVVIWFLKFFPIGFLITFSESEKYRFGLAELSKWRDKDIDFEVDIPVYLNNIPHQFWPEAPTPTSVVIYGQEAIVAFDWKKLKKKLKS